MQPYDGMLSSIWHRERGRDTTPLPAPSLTGYLVAFILSDTQAVWITFNRVATNKPVGSAAVITSKLSSPTLDCRSSFSPALPSWLCWRETPPESDRRSRRTKVRCQGPGPVLVVRWGVESRRHRAKWTR